MQQGSIIRCERKHAPAVWQFRWSETGPQGQRIYRKRVVGTVEEYVNSEAVRESVRVLIARPGPAIRQMTPVAMTVGELCQHFQQRELVQDDNWRSYSTRRNYYFLLNCWIVPRWGEHELSEVRTIEVESWLRGLARARSTCAKIRNLMSVLFNHAWRYELFDRKSDQAGSPERQKTSRSQCTHSRRNQVATGQSRTSRADAGPRGGLNRLASK